MLQEPYATALDQAVDYLRKRYEPVAIIASGSIVRGTGHAASDLDIVAIHDLAWRQRIQHRFNGVPCEVFVNPGFQLRRQFAKDARAGRPTMAHMLATGMVVHDPSGIAETLRDEAEASLAAGPQIDPADLDFRRYGIVTQCEDAVDIVTLDPDLSRALAIDALIAGAKWWFLANDRWLPRNKMLLAEVDRLDPDLGARIRDVLRESDVPRQVQLAEAAVQALVGATGFYEWDGEPEMLAKEP